MKTTKRLGLYLPILSVLVIIAVTLRTIALFTGFNNESGYFDSDILISVSNIITFGGVVFLLSYAFASKKISVIADFTGPETYIPSGLVSVSLVFLSVESFITLSKNKGGLIGKDAVTDFALLISALLAILCVVNFFFNVFFAKKENESRAFFGILTVLFLAFYAVYLYFEKKLPINSPNKTVDQMAFLFAAVFFLFETRISLGREKWRPYVGFGFVSVLLSAYSSIPTLIYYFAKGEMISDSLSECILVFALLIYALSRVALLDRLNENKKCENAEAIEVLARMRAEELTLPSQARIENKEDEEFNTMGKNYEIDLHLNTANESKRKDESEENDEGNTEEDDERNDR